jgi:SAM-dependent methyltransferase
MWGRAARSAAWRENASAVTGTSLSGSACVPCAVGMRFYATAHAPVLLDAVVAASVDALAGHAAPRVLDCTVGGGGHAAALLASAPAGTTLVGCDLDAKALSVAADRLRPFGGRVELRHESYAAVAAAAPPGSWDFVLADLGVSSFQLDTPAAGFRSAWYRRTAREGGRGLWHMCARSARGAASWRPTMGRWTCDLDGRHRHHPRRRHRRQRTWSTRLPPRSWRTCCTPTVRRAACVAEHGAPRWLQRHHIPPP